MYKMTETIVKGKQFFVNKELDYHLLVLQLVSVLE